MLEHILTSAKQKIELTANLIALQQIKVEFLGKQSSINQEMKKLGQLNEEERKNFGLAINKVKKQIQELISKRYIILEEEELNNRFYQEKLDLTIPARHYKQGSIHPITQCLEELIQIFAQLGFTIKYGPDIENEWYNFTALNIDENHPARQMHDTFYLQGREDSGNMLLRTHTSPIQIRTMQNEKPPFRFIAPGRTYRSDSDITHTPMFHQLEGLVIEKDIHMGHLKYVINKVITGFFENSDIEMQFRPSFFPFTEPSAEVDIRLQGSDKWLEVLGCGMVHSNVFKNVGIDPTKYQGFAFGLGIERFAMLKYGINDLRQFFDGDMRWLKHYGFSPFNIPSLVYGLVK